MRRYLFAGPTLPDAASLLAGTGVRLLPPVAGGDLLRLPLAPGDAVGIVDGYFHQTQAVRHKEILAVLARGVRVLGAASIGALRAAELDRLGMEGIGEIYRDYRDGVLEADDEVALVHGPADSDYRPMSEPLVNIRATLHRAERAGLLDGTGRHALIGELSRRSYRRRTYQELTRIARRLGMAAETVAALDRFCAGQPVNRKRQDALRLVEVLVTPSRRAAASRPVPVARTAFLESWELGCAAPAGVGDARPPDLAVLRVAQLFARDFPALYRDLVLRRLADECADLCGAREHADVADAAVAHGVHRGVYPAVHDATGFGFLRQWLTGTEQRTLGRRERIAAFLVRGFRVAPGIVDERGMLSALVGTPGLAAARALVGAAHEMNTQAGEVVRHFDPMAIDERRIVTWFARHWRTTPEDLPLATLDRGLESMPALVAVARPYYLLARYNPVLVDLRLAAA